VLVEGLYLVLKIFLNSDIHNLMTYNTHSGQHILIIKPTRFTNFSNLFLELNSTYFGQFLCPSSGVFHYTHSNGICHTACEQFRPDPARKLYDIHVYHCCVYSEKLLMMNRGTLRNT